MQRKARYRVYKRHWFSNVSLYEIMFCLLVIAVLNGIMFRYGNEYLNQARTAVLYAELGKHREMLLIDYNLTGHWRDNEEYFTDQKDDSGQGRLIRQLVSVEGRTADGPRTAAQTDRLYQLNQPATREAPQAEMEKAARSDAKAHVLSHWLTGPGEDPNTLLAAAATTGSTVRSADRTRVEHQPGASYHHIDGSWEGSSSLTNYFFTVNGSIVYRHNVLSRQTGAPVFVGFAPVAYSEREAMIVRYVCDQSELLGLHTLGPLINTSNKNNKSTGCLVW